MKKKIEEHTKKHLVSIVRDFNLHNAIRNYSKLRKGDLINKMARYITYNENTHKFSRKSVKGKRRPKPKAKAKAKVKRRIQLVKTSPPSTSSLATSSGTKGQQTEAAMLRSLATRAAAMDAQFTDVLF
tara:strand:- start:273 stop:656 length:384 start_codon:yes stop_codon:yes gene_type:complete